MFPYERSLVEKWQDEPFALIGVNTDPPERLSKYVKNGTSTWRNFRDVKAGGPISSKWDIVGWTTIYVLDHKGIIRHVGQLKEDLDKTLTKLIREVKKN